MINNSLLALFGIINNSTISISEFIDNMGGELGVKILYST